jgi:hypothetical protein
VSPFLFVAVTSHWERVTPEGKVSQEELERKAGDGEEPF